MAPTDGYGSVMRVPLEPAGDAGGDAVGLDLDLGAHLLQRGDVEVDRAPPDAVAADERDERLVGPVQERAEQQDRDPVEPGELERHARAWARRSGIDRDAIALDRRRPRPIDRRMSAVMPTSPTAGALVIVDGESAISAATMCLVTAFFEPATWTSPRSGPGGVDAPGLGGARSADAEAGASMRRGYWPPGRQDDPGISPDRPLGGPPRRRSRPPRRWRRRPRSSRSAAARLEA